MGKKSLNLYSLLVLSNFKNLDNKSSSFSANTGAFFSFDLFIYKFDAISETLNWSFCFTTYLKIGAFTKKYYIRTMTTIKNASK